MRAVYRAITGAGQYVPQALRDATGQEMHEIVDAIVPGLLMLIGILAATTALGTAAGAAIGALAGGVGAAPGAVIGASAGFEAGVALLDSLGLAFLAVYIGKSLVRATSIAGKAVRTAWDSVDNPRFKASLIDRASKDLALAVAFVFRGVFQGIVAFLLAKGTAAAAERVPELVAKLRSSRLGAVFADWVQRNWRGLIDNPRLKDPTPASRGGGAVGGSVGETAPSSNQPLRTTRRLPEKTSPPPVREEPSSASKSSAASVTTPKSGQIPYGSSDLSQKAITYRQAENIGSGRNVAVYEYRAGDGSLQTVAGASERGVGHAERIVGSQLEDMGVEPSQVTRIYSELQPCNMPGGYCAPYIANAFPQAQTTWSFEYGATAESRAAGVAALKAATQSLGK